MGRSFRRHRARPSTPAILPRTSPIQHPQPPQIRRSCAAHRTHQRACSTTSPRTGLLGTSHLSGRTGTPRSRRLVAQGKRRRARSPLDSRTGPRHGGRSPACSTRRQCNSSNHPVCTRCRSAGSPNHTKAGGTPPGNRCTRNHPRRMRSERGSSFRRRSTRRSRGYNRRGIPGNGRGIWALVPRGSTTATKWRRRPRRSRPVGERWPMSSPVIGAYPMESSPSPRLLSLGPLLVETAQPNVNGESTCPSDPRR